MLSKIILAVVLAAAAIGARAQSPVYGTPGTSGSPVFWPTQSGSPVFGLPSSVTPTQLSAWPMNEGSGLTLRDTSGNSNTATINTTGAVTWQSNAGLPGTTPIWNGTGYALASSTTLTNFDGTAPFSVSSWINFGSLQNGTLMGTLNAAGSFQGWELQLQDPGNTRSAISFFLINSYPSNAINVTTNGTISFGLHYVVVTYDGSRTAAGVKVYVDATLLANTALTDTLTASAASGLPVRFGARSDGTDELTTVAMAFDEAVPGALSQATISANFTKGPGIY